MHYPIPPHLSEAYRELGYCEGDLPITEHYARTVLSLPMYNGMTEAEQAYVIAAVNDYEKGQCHDATRPLQDHPIPEPGR